jgi:hypothetical protein
LDQGQLHTEFSAVIWSGTTFRNLVVQAAATNMRFGPKFVLRGFAKFRPTDTQCSLHFEMEFWRLHKYRALNVRMLVPNKYLNKGAHPALVTPLHEPISQTCLAQVQAPMVGCVHPFNSKLLAHLCSISMYVSKSEVCPEILRGMRTFPNTIFVFDTAWDSAQSRIRSSDPGLRWMDYKSMVEAWRDSKLEFANVVPIRIMK